MNKRKDKKDTAVNPNSSVFVLNGTHSICLLKNELVSFTIGDIVENLETGWKTTIASTGYHLVTEEFTIKEFERYE